MIDKMLIEASILESKSREKSKVKLTLSERITILVVGEIILLLASIYISFWLWTLYKNYAFTQQIIIKNIHIVWIICPWIMISVISGAYSLKTLRNLLRSLKQPLRTAILVWIIYIMIYFFAPRDALPRIIILFFGFISCVLLIFWRYLHFAVFSRDGFRQKIAIVGNKNSSQQICGMLQRHQLYYEIVACITPDDLTKSISLQTNDIDEIVYMVEEDLSKSLSSLIKFREKGIAITPFPLFFERLWRRTPIKFIQGWYMSFLPLEDTESNKFYPIAKRIIDIFCALLGSCVFILLLPFLAILIKLDSPGPIFFSQWRIGKNNTPFRLWKLRTMVKNAEHQGAMWTEHKDKRITRIGKWLRKSRFDEFPQLWNVLKGELSIVGVRPLSVQQCEIFAKEIPFHNLRHLVKPGITSWAVVNFKHVNDITGAERRLEYDLFYVKYQSIWLDFFIIFRTIWIVITLRGL